MIVRAWRGIASPEKAETYQRHFASTVAPHLKEIAGHRGAYLLKRDVDSEVEFLALTLWESIESIRAFTGPDPDVAIVEPEGRAALSHIDEFARNYEMVFSDVQPS